MKFDLQEDQQYQFPFWFTTIERLDLNSAMNISEWCGNIFGELGTVWGFFQTTKQLPINALTPSKSTPLNRLPTPIYSWRFKNKDDAMLFKLTWGGE